ncbi:MAG: hypothetical protein DMG89_06310 [Acidobacteria bacterium]|nr:MAG: hypothetical protein DMG89_06310 [Acidobacteriota bacterium]
MSTRTALVICGTTLLLLAHAAGQNVVFPKMDHLKNNETFHSAKLSATEIKQISEEIEATAFDTPDSWESELRVRRVLLGEAPGLVLQGTKLLCGATGNCQTWVLRRADDHWLSLFKNQAPIASGFGFDEKTTNGIQRFVVAANSSAADSKYVVYDFDGKFYRESACYSRHDESGEKPHIQQVSCK